VKPLSSKKGTTKKSSNTQTELEKGDSALRSGDLKQAHAHYLRAVQMTAGSEDQVLIGTTRLNSARVEDLMGHYTQALAAYQEALKHFLQAGEKALIAKTKAHLGSVGWAMGDYSEAGRLLAEALYLYEEIADARGQAWIQDLVGNLKLAMRDDQEAERSYLKSHELMGTLGATEEVKAWEFYHRGTVELFREHFPQAKAYFDEALKSFQKDGDLLGRVAAHIHLGEIACEQKDLTAAQGHFHKAVEGVLPTGCTPLLMDGLVGVSQLLKAQGLERKAIGILMVALSHPTCRQQTKDRMVALVIHLESRFTSQEIKGGFQWAKEVTIEEMAKAWVDSLVKDTKTKNRK
jgi:tetratricopeptide (TPR) repeat protein